MHMYFMYCNVRARAHDTVELSSIMSVTCMQCVCVCVCVRVCVACVCVCVYVCVCVCVCV